MIEVKNLSVFVSEDALLTQEEIDRFLSVLQGISEVKTLAAIVADMKDEPKLLSNAKNGRTIELVKVTNPGLLKFIGEPIKINEEELIDFIKNNSNLVDTEDAYLVYLQAKEKLDTLEGIKRDVE